MLNPDYYATEGAERHEPDAAGVGRTATSACRRTFAWGSRVGNAPPNMPFPGYFNINATQDVSISLTKVAGRHTFKTGLLQHAQLQGRAGARRVQLVRRRSTSQQDTVGTNPFDTSFGFANAAIGTLQLVQPGVEVRRRQLRLRQHRGLHPGQLEGEQQADARLRRAVRAPDAAVRQDWARRSNFLPDEWVSSATRRCSTRRAARSRSRRYRVPGPNRQAQNPRDRPVPRAELDARDRHAGARHRATRPTALFAGGQGIVGHDLHVPGARRRAAVRHGVRPDRQPEGRAARRRRVCSSTGRSATRSISWPGNPPSSRSSRCATRSCRASAAAA